MWDELKIPKNGCTVATGHEWQPSLEPGGQGNGNSFRRDKKAGRKRGGHQPGFCQKCNAWRGSLGLEPTPELYIQHIVQVFKEIWRVLRSDGVIFLNLGDSYWGSGQGSGHDEFTKNAGRRTATYGVIKGHSLGKHPIYKAKDLCMIPARVALALQADGWWLRSAMPWVKRSAMPESVTDRPASALEYVFLLTKSEKYFFDMEAVKKTRVGDNMFPGNKPQDLAPDGSSVSRRHPSQAAKRGDIRPWGNSSGRSWRNTDLFYQSIEPPHGMILAGDEPVGLDVNPQSFGGAHFATFAEALVSPLIKAGTSEKGCCPECGAAWVRIIEKGPLKEHPDRQNRTDRNKADFNGIDYAVRDSTLGLVAESKTIGWNPSCECKTYRSHPLGYKGPDKEVPFNPIPCTVLDPFGGSGRTAIVAKKLGRKCIIIELKGEYCEMPLKELSQEVIF